MPFTKSSYNGVAYRNISCLISLIHAKLKLSDTHLWVRKLSRPLLCSSRKASSSCSIRPIMTSRHCTRNSPWRPGNINRSLFKNLWRHWKKKSKSHFKKATIIQLFNLESLILVRIFGIGKIVFISTNSRLHIHFSVRLVYLLRHKCFRNYRGGSKVITELRSPCQLRIPKCFHPCDWHWPQK